jgi:hypothetical protein
MADILNRADWARVTKAKARNNFTHALPRRHGAIWNAAEVAALNLAIRHRIDLASIAATHLRSANSIYAKVEALAAIQTNQVTGGAWPPEPPVLTEKVNTVPNPRKYQVCITHTQIQRLHELVKAAHKWRSELSQEPVNTDSLFTNAAKVLAALSRGHKTGTDDY